MGRTESRQDWQTGRRDAWIKGSPQMRQSAGKRSENAVSARERVAVNVSLANVVRASVVPESVVLENQAATVAPTLARSTPVARASSTLLLKTASCTRSPIEGSSLPVPKV